MRNEHPLDYILRLRKPNKDAIDSAFDLICAHNYFAGQFGQNIPTDKSRECWNKLKSLLTEKNS